MRHIILNTATIPVLVSLENIRYLGIEDGQLCIEYVDNRVIKIAIIDTDTDILNKISNLLK